MSKVVVDASIAVKWILVEHDSSDALALLADWSANGVILLAPALFACEITNILHQRTRRGAMTPEEARNALARLLVRGVELDHFDDRALSQRALELAQTFGLPATYDAHYLALAEREGCDYWTADERRWNTLHGAIGWIRLLRDFAPRVP